MSGRALALALLLAAAAGPLRAAELEVEARVEPALVARDEPAVLLIEVRGGGFGRLGAEPEFHLDNLALAGGPNRSESFQMVNGAVSRSVTLSWRLRPLAPGRAAVRGLRVRVRDQIFELGDREIEVSEETAGVRSPPASADPLEELAPLLDGRSGLRRSRPKLLLRAEVSPAEPWAGQQVLYTLYLYTQADVNSVQPKALPAFRGFWVHEVTQPQRPQPDMVILEGERFARVVLLQRALFPLQPGALEIEPVAADLAVKVPEGRGLLGSFFSNVEPRHLVSNAVTVQSRPLPPAPPGFAGAVGALDLEARLEPPAVPVGEAATLTLTLSGEGHLQGLSDPPVAAPAGVRLFPPQEEGSQEAAGQVVRSRRSWTYVLIPERRGRFVLPPVEVPYFDPRLASYRMAASAALELEAAPRAAAPRAASAAVAEPHPVRSAALPAPALPDWRRLLPWAFALPWVVGGALLLSRRRESAAAGGGRGHGARRRLQERLRQAASEGRPRPAAAQVEDAWRDYLQERWGIAPGVASTQWAAELRERGADADAAADLVRLADDLHYLRYAPQLSSTATLQSELLERSRRLLRALR